VAVAGLAVAVAGLAVAVAVAGLAGAHRSATPQEVRSNPSG